MLKYVKNDVERYIKIKNSWKVNFFIFSEKFEVYFFCTTAFKTVKGAEIL